MTVIKLRVYISRYIKRLGFRYAGKVVIMNIRIITGTQAN